MRLVDRDACHPFIHVSRDCFIDNITVFRLLLWKWRNPEGYGKYQPLSNHNKPLESANRVHMRRHQMQTFSALLALCVGNSLVTGEFPSQRPVTRSSDVFFDLRLNKRLCIQSRRRGFETLSSSLWCHCNGIILGMYCMPATIQFNIIHALPQWTLIQIFTANDNETVDIFLCSYHMVTHFVLRLP